TGTDAADTFIGGTGDDYYAGGFGNDTLRGGEGNDSLNGGADNDTLYAGRGNDVLRGGNGNDKLYGEAGNDVYHGGRGNDSFTDTQGDDTYYFAQGDGADTLLDTQGEDTLVFEGIDHTSLWFTQTGPNGRNLEISVYGTDDKITVTDWFLSGSRQIEHIQAGDYVLDGAEVAALAEALADFGPTMVGEGDYLLLRWPDEIFDQYWNAV
ncbi:MAG: hypothetical protein LBP58_06835, partial [Azoarcus sp.]|nr:hypothetical protein [Azoarcus sp.]